MERRTKSKLPKIMYTVEEENWLIINALDYRDIIENKKTDGATKLDKDKAWENITKAFNVAPPNQERSVKSLREKYQKIKQNLKNRALYYDKNSKQTGCESAKKELSPLSEPMQELFAILMKSTYRLSAASGDSDEVSTPEPKSVYQHKGTRASTKSPDQMTIDNEPFSFKIDVDDADEADLTDKITESSEIQSVQNIISQIQAEEHSWGRVNRSKLQKPPNALLRHRRQKYNTGKQSYCRISKSSAKMQQQLAAKHVIEMEILECERERFKLERRKAALEVERATFERERAEFDRERSLIELQRSKNHLDYDRKFYLARMANLKGNQVEKTSVPRK